LSQVLPAELIAMARGWQPSQPPARGEDVDESGAEVGQMQAFGPVETCPREGWPLA
jgi:hypothetical protein